MTPGRVFRTLVVVTIAAAASLSGSPALNAQSLGSIELVAQSSWVDEGGIFNAQVRVAGADPESTVIFEILGPWENRGAFLDRDVAEAETLLTVGPTVLSEVQDTSNEVIGLEVEVSRQPPVIPTPEELEDDAAAPAPALLTTGDPAVYPLVASLLTADGEIIDSFVSSIIHLPRRPIGSALATSLILESPIGTSIDIEGLSTLTREDIAELSILVEAIAQHPNDNVSLSITGETLLSLQRSQLLEAREILDMIRDSFSADQLVPQPFSALEEQAWIDAGLTRELVDLYKRSEEATIDITGIEPNGSVAVLDSTVTSAGLAELLRLGVEGIVAESAVFEPLDDAFFPESLTTRFLVPAPGVEPLPAMVFDTDLANHFVAGDSAVIDANRMLADLTLLSLQHPNTAQGAFVRPPPDWIPDATFLNVLLNGLERIPSVDSTSPENVLANTTFAPARGIDSLSPPLQRDLLPQRSPVDLRAYRTEFSQAQATIEAWSTVIASNTQDVGRLNELLELSTNGEHGETQRNAYIDQIYNIIDTQRTDSITTPATETITLTGRRSEVPIVIDNNLDTDTAVLLVLDSEKLDFPEGREIDAVLTPGSNRIEVPIEARGSGDSPIRIQVFSPDRSILLGSAEIVVRLLAFSGVGVLIGGLAILVLLGWWLRHLRSARGTVEDSTAHPDSQDSGELIGV